MSQFLRERVFESHRCRNETIFLLGLMALRGEVGDVGVFLGRSIDVRAIWFEHFRY